MLKSSVDPLGILTGPYTLTSLTPPDLSRCTNEEVLEYFENTYSLNESIYTVLKSEDAFYKCPDRLRLPLIFYYGHTASVYVNKLVLAGLITERVNFELETMFETGVDEMNWDDIEHYRMGGSYHWPKLAEVKEFRQEVRDIIRGLIKSAKFSHPITMDDPHWAIFMGMAHERIHLETSSVLIRQLPIDLVRVPAQWKRGPVKTEAKEVGSQMRSVPATKVLMGKPVDFPSYGWDNEYPQFEVNVPAFEASEFLVTNGEFYQFVLEGGYREESFWSKEGWQWRSYREAIHPTFWVCTKGCKVGCGGDLAQATHCKQTCEDIINLAVDNGKPSFGLRTLCEVIDMPWTWPVVVNCLEAQAFCQWKGEGYRLITEAEHNAIRDLKPVSSKQGTACDPAFDPHLETKRNSNLAYCTSTPVDHYPPNEAGFYDVFGNVWQWTEDHFNGIPGMETHYIYDDFSAPCLDGRHNLILGGSWVSTGIETSRFARYNFRRHFFQHSGFRLARSKDNNKVPVRLLQFPHIPEYEIPFHVSYRASLLVDATNTQFRDEDPKAVVAQLMSEYTYQPDGLYAQLSGFIQRFIKPHNIPTVKALNLNTGCGRMTFELCRYFTQVVGTDFSGAFIEACQDLQQNGSRTVEALNGEHTVTINGDKPERFTAEVPTEVNPLRAVFKQFTWVPNELTDLDFVLVGNLHRVMNKKSWLVRLWEIIKPSGLVVIYSTKGLGAKELQSLIGNRLKCTQTEELPIRCDGQKESTLVLTAWERDV